LRTSRSRVASIFLLAAVGFVLSHCGRSRTSNPVAVATPTATTVPTAVPTPTDCQLPHDGGPGCIPPCSFGHGTGTGADGQCPVDHDNADPVLFQAVTDAVLSTEAEHPELIVVEDHDVRLSNENRLPFFRIVIHKLQAEPGICAADDGLEIAIKSTNDFSEQYKFWVTPPKKSDLGTIRLDNMKVATCRPAWF
jgi:hypothetical protein